MITFHIITIFPEIFEKYFKSSLMARAIKKKIIKINLINLRDFTKDKYKQLDDKPFGGGPGMVLKVEPIFKAVQLIKKKLKNKKTKTILFSLKGKKFNQNSARRLSKLNHIILICGHYEGVDERVAKYIADEEISIGNFVLSGGELPAMILTETISRLLPKFLGNIESIEEKRIKKYGKKLLSFPVYTRPEIFYPNQKEKKKIWKTPKILLSGNHKKIQEWREKNVKEIGE
jgi:tRNA (guanine37-N1)-methyltransferase